MKMKLLLNIEYMGLFVLSVYLFSNLNFAWWVYPLLILTPDLGMVGYLAGPRVGAYTYNFTHHLGLAVLLFIGGGLTGMPGLQLAGIIILGHSASDRILGFGLKYTDSFQHTHLGMIGSGK